MTRSGDVSPSIPAPFCFYHKVLKINFGWASLVAGTAKAINK